MIAKQAKAKMLWWMLYRFNFLAAVTEFDFADVFAISRAKYSHEVEIKVSRADLMSELNCIDIVLGRIPQTKYFPNHFKHRNYILAEFPTFTRPNYFSFAVPESLIDVALPHLEGTPYGYTSWTRRIITSSVSGRLSIYIRRMSRREAAKSSSG
jgi:hypothetical protein